MALRALNWALSGVLAVSTWVASAPAFAASPVTVDHSHVDICNRGVKDGKIHLAVTHNLTGSDMPRNAEIVRVVVQTGVLLRGVPDINVPQNLAADGFHDLPPVQATHLLWPGWEPPQLQRSSGTRVKASCDLVSVDSSDQVFLSSSGQVRGVAPLRLGDPYGLPGAIKQSPAAHVHAQLGFTKPGSYKLKDQATISTKNGSKKATSHQAVSTIDVRPVATSVCRFGPVKRPSGEKPRSPERDGVYPRWPFIGDEHAVHPAVMLSVFSGASLFDRMRRH